MIKNKSENFLESMANAKQKTPNYLRKPYFQDIISSVTPNASAYTQGQIDLVEASEWGTCSGVFKTSTGFTM